MKTSPTHTDSNLHCQIIQDNGEQKLAILPPDSGPVFVDFTAGKKAHRRLFGGGMNQPLAKAIGLNSKHKPSVLDATAGMGADSFVLANLGCQVTMIERSEAVASLLADGLQRAQQSPDVSEIIARMTLINADSADYLESQAPNVEVIYLDPMYPEKKKKAAPKKEMKLLQNLVGPDIDSEKLLAAALKVATKRVVVKRPKGAPTIGDLTPHAEVTSPNTRYDIYSIKALPPRETK